VRSAAVAFAVAIATLYAAQATAAEGDKGKTSSLSWLRMPGADSCIATQPLARAVEERLGRETFVSAAQADLSVEGRIEKKPKGGWRAVITMRDPNGALLGTRELERDEASCEAMTEPLALIIAVMIDPDAAMRPKTEPAKSDPTPPPSPPPVVDPPPTTPPTRDEPPVLGPKRPLEPWRFEGGGHAMMLAGLAPELAWGAGVNGILYPPGSPIGFRGTTTLFLPTTAEGNGRKVDFDMLLFGGSICPTIRRRVNLMGCIGGHVGILRPRSGDLLAIWNLAAELRISIPIAQPIEIGAGAGAALPIFRPKYENIYRSDVVAFTADVMVGFFFP
jgi:hypothetical protein